MFSLLHVSLFFCLCSLISAEFLPYNRYHGVSTKRGLYEPDPSRPEFEDKPKNIHSNWLQNIINVDSTGQLQKFFPPQVKDPDIQDIFTHAAIPPVNTNMTLQSHGPQTWPRDEVKELFKNLHYKTDPKCTSDPSQWWYRTYDGSCNWLKDEEFHMGQRGTARCRDYNQHSYTDGISSPREGPNPRALSNAFFKRKEKIYYEHTPILIGLIEFIMHDITYSLDSTTEFITVPMPDDEVDFSPNTTFVIPRTEKVVGTGTGKDNPREGVNMATTWLDLSALYGSTKEVAYALRAFKSGKLLTQGRKTRGAKSVGEYLPFNVMGVPTRSRPGASVTELFAGGDPRTNEDWIMLAVHTLLLREHNRLCDILATQHPEYDDEQLYQTVRLLLSSKYMLIANAYQMAYWTDEMPWPQDDGFPLYRQMYGEDILKINNANTYPWPLVTRGGKPMTVSAEMAVVYRFHEFIVESFPIKDASNETLWEQDLFATGFNATGFIDAGLDNILRGSVATSIPNFKSGVDESFRSAGKYRGRPFDLVTWSIVHEREQGLPTFNEYFRAYNKQDPKVVVPIRNTFEEFSSDPTTVENLRRLYNNTDEVDLVVGVQLDEEFFPGTTVPKSSLIISLFSLFGMGNSDRFSIGFAMMRCLLVDKPWDCHPSNALEDLLWKPEPKENYPNFRTYDTFWLKELDVQAKGKNLLWRLVVENTEIGCLQRDPLFPMHPEKNPILCKLPDEKPDYKNIALTAVIIIQELTRQHMSKILAMVGALALIFISPVVLISIIAIPVVLVPVLLVTLLLLPLLLLLAAGIAIAAAFSVGLYVVATYPRTKSSSPPIIHGYPLVGAALSFGKDPKGILLSGFGKYGDIFGIKLGRLTNFVLTKREDMEMLIKDNPYEAKFSLGKFFEEINMEAIVGGRENFETDLHSKLIRSAVENPATVKSFGHTLQLFTLQYFKTHPLIPTGHSSAPYTSLSPYLTRYITAASCRLFIGPESLNHPELVDLYINFNEDIDLAMGVGMILPRWLGRIAGGWKLKRDYTAFRKILKPIVQRRRADMQMQRGIGEKGGLIEEGDFLPFVLNVVEDDERACDLIAIAGWVGLRNLQATTISSILDIINIPSLPSAILTSLSATPLSSPNTFSTTTLPSPWSLLRSCVLESIRLCGTIIGPSRLITSRIPVPLPSNQSLTLPPGEIVTLSPYYVHRQSTLYPSASSYIPDRWVDKMPDIGSPEWVSWGLKGPHMCPGRWLAQEVICVLVRGILEEYEFVPEVMGRLDEEVYGYKAGEVIRREVGGVVYRREKGLWGNEKY